jgi:hypothetical protein
MQTSFIISSAAKSSRNWGANVGGDRRGGVPEGMTVEGGGGVIVVAGVTARTSLQLPFERLVQDRRQQGVEFGGRLGLR